MAKIDYSTFASPNDADNLTVAQAHEMIVVMMAMDMPYDDVTALQGSVGAPGAQEISINNVIAAKLPADQKFYFIGRYRKDADQKAYTLAEDRQFFFIPQADGSEPKQKDGLESFIDVWTDRHPGHSRADAVQAADELGSINTAIAHEFASIRALVTN